VCGHLVVAATCSSEEQEMWTEVYGTIIPTVPLFPCLAVHLFWSETFSDLFTDSKDCQKHEEGS
jgi:hypothetical protein